MKKTIITIILAFIVSASIAQYHIRVECDNGLDYGPQYYRIVYTTNNWIGSNNLKEIIIQQQYYTTDINDLRSYDDVIIFQFYSPDKNRLIEVAKNFKLYSDIVAYNTKLNENFKKRKAYYLSIRPKITPFKPKPSLKAKQECCKPIQIY